MYNMLLYKIHFDIFIIMTKRPYKPYEEQHSFKTENGLAKMLLHVK
jgi:hypothetical protein